MKIVREIEERIEKGKAAIFECEYCSNHFKANISRVKSGRIKSCGCLVKTVAREKAYTLHETRKSTDNRTKTRLYRYWIELKSQCNPKSTKYNGTSIFKEWEKYEPFKEWYDQHYVSGQFLCWEDSHISPETCYFTDKKTASKIERQNTNQRKYGEPEYCSTEEFKNKVKDTCVKKYGVDHVSKKPEFRALGAKTLKDKTKEEKVQILKKREDTCVDRYGVKFPQLLPTFREKMMESRKDNDFHIFIGDKSLKQYLLDNEIDVAYSTAVQLYHKHGTEFIKYLPDRLSTLEKFVASILDRNSIEYSTLETVNKCRTDFVVNDLVIECDGLYWHSDAILEDKNYHVKKMTKYKEAGYKSLFFREDEIYNTPEIVESIILNKLNLTQNKVYARKTEVREISSKVAGAFCQKNHLMGKGAGRSFGLFNEEELITVIRVKKKGGGLDISRFCHKLNTNVVGGFSKLVKHIEKEMQPEFIQTFIDMRYGSGEYLSSLGFEFICCHKSFKWTDFKKTYHRYKYPGNSGYDNKLFKIWDCGQSKWVKY
jgi:very-short-patch-repair endonuclease